MRVLLTGSTGWLGRHLAPMLRDAGHEVIGMDVAPGPDGVTACDVEIGPLPGMAENPQVHSGIRDRH